MADSIRAKEIPGWDAAVNDARAWLEKKGSRITKRDLELVGEFSFPSSACPRLIERFFIHDLLHMLHGYCTQPRLRLAPPLKPESANDA